MNDFLLNIAPTVASALLGPLGGVAVAGLGKIFGIDGATTKDITKAITDSKITPDQLAEIQKLELQFKNDEAERGFKYAELQFKDTDSARNLAVQTHSLTPSLLTWLIVVLTLSAEIGMLFHVIPAGANEMVMGRVLGTLDAALVMVLGFWFGSSHGSQNKDTMIANMTSNP